MGRGDTGGAFRYHVTRSFAISTLDRPLAAALWRALFAGNDRAVKAWGSLSVGGVSIESSALGALAAALALAGCDTDGTPTLGGRHLQPLSDRMLAEIENRNMAKESPILVR